MLYVLMSNYLRIEEPNDVSNEDEIDAVAQVLDDWDPMAEDHFKEKRF